MFAKERQDKIIAMIKDNGAVTTSDLVRIFDVSIETIRRDLLNMEKHGQLLRVHGGAVAGGEMKPFPELKERSKEFGSQKKELSQTAAEFVSDGDIIGIDSGSTAIFFAEAIKNRFTKLTVITHSLDVFNILCNRFSVILCGGQYVNEENTFCGALTLDMLEKLHMQKTFIFPSAISLECGIGDFHQDLYSVQKQLLKSSEKIYILADSSKFEKKALLKLDNMNPDYIYVTDSNLPKELIKVYKNNNIKIYISSERKNH